MAAQDQNIGQVTGIMLVFGIGAAIPLLPIGLASRGLINRWRDRIRMIGPDPVDVGSIAELKWVAEHSYMHSILMASQAPPAACSAWARWSMSAPPWAVSAM